MATSTLTLTDFLLAQIAAEATPALLLIADELPMRYAADDLNGPTRDEEYSGLTIGAGRVLAECAAKRELVAIATDQIRLGREARGWDNWEGMANQTLRALAQPYAGKPGWREEWA